MCPKNSEKHEESSFTTCRLRLSILCLVEHIAGKGVTWRRVALTKKKKRWKSGKWEKVKEECWTFVEKRGKKRREGQKGVREKFGERVGKRGEKRRRREGGKGRKREKGRLGRRPVTRYRKHRWNNACHCPSPFARETTMFEPPRKNTKKYRKKQKKRTFEQSAHWFVTTNRPKWHLHRPRRPQMLTIVLRHQRPRENATNNSKNDKLMSKFEKCRKHTANTTICCPN